MHHRILRDYMNIGPADNNNSGSGTGSIDGNIHLNGDGSGGFAAGNNRNSRGSIQQLQKEATTFCGMVIYVAY